MSRVVIIDYGSGNLRSAANAFQRAAGSGSTIEVSDNPKALETATHIVLPGVGAFADCMRGLTATQGMRAALERQVLENKKPFLGVCVGMQMLFDTGHEHGTHKGLGWIAGEVVKIGAKPPYTRRSEATTPLEGERSGGDTSPPRKLKIPHMGWNELSVILPHPLVSGITNGAHAYFVHSYHAVCEPSAVVATTDYGGPLTAVVCKSNVMGTQFHPEKSQAAGLQLIGNFLRLQ